MSSQAARAAASETSAARKSAGTLCTTPLEIAFLLISTQQSAKRKPAYRVLNQNGLDAANRSDPSTLTLPCT